MNPKWALSKVEPQPQPQPTFPVIVADDYIFHPRPWECRRF